MIETYSHPDNVRLHAGACQVKVFKLKGADRKHKQDREKIIKKTIGEQAKLQPSYECTVLSDVRSILCTTTSIIISVSNSELICVLSFSQISLDSLESPPTAAAHAQQGQTQLLSPAYSTEHPVADSPENNSPPNANALGCFSPDSVRRWLLKNR